MQGLHAVRQSGLILDEPGLHFLWLKLGWKAPLVNFVGRSHTLDMRMDQEYLRSQPVNSEEGAPMGIGIWYEMFISDPVSYLFKNADPRGSLAANVSNSTVRCLSNLKLASMLEDRHTMSQTVRAEVSPKSHEWGYQLGSVYIRKVSVLSHEHDTHEGHTGWDQPYVPGGERFVRLTFITPAPTSRTTSGCSSATIMIYIAARHILLVLRPSLTS